MSPVNGDGRHEGEGHADGWDTLQQIEFEVARLLRFADGTRRAGRSAGHLDRSAYLLLAILSENGPTSVNALADRLSLNASTITRQVDAMAASGLVQRVKHPADGRVTLVAATPHGGRELTRNRTSRHHFYENVTASWPEHDRRALASLLSRLTSDLESLARSD